MWEGEFGRAIALLDSRVIPANDPALGVVPIILKCECLLFDQRLDEARALFETHATALNKSTEGVADVVAIAAFVRFYDGELDAEEYMCSALPLAKVSAV